MSLDKSFVNVVIVDAGHIGILRSEERLFLYSHGWSHSDCITSATCCTF